MKGRDDLPFCVVDDGVVCGYASILSVNEVMRVASFLYQCTVWVLLSLV